MRTSTNTIDNNDDEDVATAIIRATSVASGLKHAIRAFILKEQTDTLTAVMRRLNSDEDGRHLETIKREPILLIAMLLEEHSKRLQEELIALGQKEEKENND